MAKDNSAVNQIRDIHPLDQTVPDNTILPFTEDRAMEEEVPKIEKISDFTENHDAGKNKIVIPRLVPNRDTISEQAPRKAFDERPGKPTSEQHTSSGLNQLEISIMENESAARTRTESKIKVDDSGASTLNTYKSWAYHNYADSGKTKTVTRKKYDRIQRALKDETAGVSSADNSKFRYWVKNKGFRIGLPASESADNELYVPTCSVNNPEKKVYKRVAVVEDFYDIIYNVHVGVEGRGGKHAGQKRTYRAISETYAFLPREAVTRFLMSCTDCQKRMHLAGGHGEHNNNVNLDLPARNMRALDFSMPITTAYLHHMRTKGLLSDVLLDKDLDDNMSGDTSSDLSVRSNSPSTVLEDHLSPLGLTPDLKQDGGSNYNSRSSTPANMQIGLGLTPVKDGRDLSGIDEPLNLHSKCILDFDAKEDRPASRKRKASDTSIESSSVKNECLDDISTNKDDDDDEEDDDKISSKDIDPETLKAFNMFVRLFVDENLDRSVPISKQPKDKIQAILEACDRQFPEFRERSRKRIRTYLKSCRRMRRSKEANGWEPLRPTPPHLTSAAAETMLATACENESNNAKRMRMGLEPLPASLTNPVIMASPSSHSSSSRAAPQSVSVKAHIPSHQKPPQLDRQPALLGLSADLLRHTQPAFRPPHHELHQPHLFANGLGALFRPGFPPAAYPNPAHHAPVIQHSPIANTVQNGPTDLSMKNKNNNHSKKSQLNSNEITTIKQLISGYRESAAFLYRSADELEALLLQQN